MPCYFAELNESNVVIDVSVVGDDVPTADGPLGDNPCHPDGEAYCRKLRKNNNHVFKQFSKDGSYRGRRAGIGYTYDENKDAFITQQPYPSWSLDNHTWVPPIARPNNLEAADGSGHYSIGWDEENQRWTGVLLPKNLVGQKYSKWNWNHVNLTWEEV